MRIIRAKHLGMCFGVRDAIGLALEQSRKSPLTIFGELVHNRSVLAELRQRGIELRTDPGQVPTEQVMITAHGASQRTIGKLTERGLKVVEATCPLVHYAHQAVRRLAQEGFHIVIIGKRDHVEVRGLTEDLDAYDVVLTEEDVNNLSERPRIGVAAQTTQPLERVHALVDLMRRRFPRSEIRSEDTVCQPTKQRQAAAVELALESDVVVVVGGSNSNNTRELVSSCLRYCPRVHHVETAKDLRPEWFERAETVGLTAGTSTPDAAIQGVEEWLTSLAARRASFQPAMPLPGPTVDAAWPGAIPIPAGALKVGEGADMPRCNAGAGVDFPRAFSAPPA